MPENINTTPLGDIERELAAAVDDRPVMVGVDPCPWSSTWHLSSSTA